MKILKGTDSRVIGRKLAGSAVTFLMDEDGTCFFHCNGISPEDQTDRIMSVEYFRKNGQRLKEVIES